MEILPGACCDKMRDPREAIFACCVWKYLICEVWEQRVAGREDMMNRLFDIISDMSSEDMIIMSIDN
jgi:hypothetical protein